MTRSLSTSNNYNYDNNAKPLSISIQSSQNIVNGRGTSTVTAIAYDANTDKKIDNAIVKLKITFTSNDTSKEIVVGHNGEVTYDLLYTLKSFGPKSTIILFLLLVMTYIL